MTNKSTTTARAGLMLNARTAEDLMSVNPISIEAGASIREAIELMTEHNFRAAPVIDDAGRPIGVISQMDILLHNREHPWHRAEGDTDWILEGGKLPEGFSEEIVDRTTVEEIMTPFVLAVTPDTPAKTVVTQLLSQKVHHLFVVDDTETLIGVISSLDVLRRLEG